VGSELSLACSAIRLKYPAEILAEVSGNYRVAGYDASASRGQLVLHVCLAHWSRPYSGSVRLSPASSESGTHASSALSSRTHTGDAYPLSLAAVAAAAAAGWFTY